MLWRLKCYEKSMNNVIIIIRVFTYIFTAMSAISMYMIRGNVLSDGLEDVVVTLINWGYPIEKDSTGVYVMLSKREKSL